MKKLLPILSTLLLFTVLLTSLVSCSKYSALKKAFEKEGYTENEKLETLAETIKSELEKKELAVTLHLLSKNLTSVLIIEFNATEDLVKAYEESSTIQGLIKDIQKSEDVNAVAKALEDAGFAKGNCLCIPLSILHVNDITEIVKSV